MSDGTVLCWGINNYGSCAMGDIGREQFGYPTRSNQLSCMTQIDQEGRIGIKADGSVLFWGSDLQGQRGQARYAPIGEATVVQGLPHPRSAGNHNITFAITDKNALLWWGSLFTSINEPRQFQENPMPLVGLPAVLQSSGNCAVDLQGKVWCWGSNVSGALGRPPGGSEAYNIEGSSATPIVVAGAGPATFVMSPPGATICAIQKADGGVKCWGDNAFGKLGRGTLDPRDDHVPASVVDLVGVTQIAGSPYATCAVTADGLAYCWGANSYHSISPGAEEQFLTPTRIGNLDDVVQVAVGESHVCLLRRDHSVWCQGEIDALGRDNLDDEQLAPVDFSKTRDYHSH
jgi:alpha-tubulin suppressor-like RCC1 family protein